MLFCLLISAGAKPKILKELKHIEVEEGEVIKLKLEFVSDLPTTVTWYKDGEVIGKDVPCKVMSTESQTVLMVRKATWDHEGLYAVKVTNDVGSVERSIDVAVEEGTRKNMAI